MTNISQKLVTIAEGLEKIRTAGWNNGFAAYAPIFWEDFNRNRADWSHMCQGWGHEEIKPSFTIYPTSTYYSFYKCKKLKTIGDFDFSNTVTSPTASASGNNRTFYGCESLTYIPDLGVPSGYYLRTFDSCKSLVTLEVFRTDVDVAYSNAFAQCGELVNINRIEGQIGQNGLDFSASKKLSHDTIMRVINALYDYSSTSGTHSLVLGSTNLTKLTDEEKAIATQKGWTLS